MATLTYNHAKQIAMVGPLHVHADPHRWDLCAEHARRTTVPMGWTLEVSDEPDDTAHDADDDDLMALAKAVQQAAADAEETLSVPEPTRIVRKVEAYTPSGRHPSRRNLPTRGPRRHLRAVRDSGPANN